MALTIKHLNSDASFLLSFEPILTDRIRGSVVIPQPFTILLDPWITGPSKIFHSKISISTHKHPACISSLAELPDPDLVIISQHKSDHCNEATLRQLPPTGTKTQILAEPASARLIRSWKYFDHDKIRTMEKWEDPRMTDKATVLRIPVPALTLGGQNGEVTVAWIPQKRDFAGLHGAIGITYKPPPTHNLAHKLPISAFITPPATPKSIKPPFFSAPLSMTLSTTDTMHFPPTPPISPHSLRSVQSVSTLLPSPTCPNFNASLGVPRPSSSSQTNLSFAFCQSRPISLLFSPHGISYPHLTPYVTAHLVKEAALPLTALLHCMDSITNPWWLGGNITSGVPTGAEIASKLYARVWVSAHDGEKDVRGLATSLLRTRRYKREEVEEVISPPRDGTISDNIGGNQKNGGIGTEILRLESGGEVVVSGDGMLWLGNNEGSRDTSVDKEKAIGKDGREMVPHQEQPQPEGETIVRPISEALPPRIELELDIDSIGRGF